MSMALERMSEGRPDDAAIVVAFPGHTPVGLIQALEEAQASLRELRESHSQLRSRATMISEAHRLQSLFLSAALESPHVGRTVQCLADTVEAPAVLQDTGMLVVATAGEGAERIALQPSQCHFTREVLRRMTLLHQIARIPASEGVAPRLVAPVVGQDQLLGYLTVATCEESPRVQAALEHAAKFSALTVLSEQKVHEAMSLDRAAFFGDLVAGRSPERLVTYGYRLGHDLRQPHVPVVFTVAPGEKRPKVLEDVVPQAVTETRSHYAPTPIFGVDDQGFAVVFTPVPDVDMVRPFMARVSGRLTERGLCVLAGAGPLCRRVEDYPTGLQKAKWVTEVLSVLPGKPPAAAFDDLGIFGLLFDKETSTDIRQFMEKWLGPLIEYDRERKTELTSTLACLLETDRQEDAAAELFIHPSTLKYRIKRIEEIMRVDLKDREVQFNMRLAARMYQVYQLTAGL